MRPSNYKSAARGSNKKVGLGFVFWGIFQGRQSHGHLEFSFLIHVHDVSFWQNKLSDQCVVPQNSRMKWIRSQLFWALTIRRTDTKICTSSWHYYQDGVYVTSRMVRTGIYGFTFFLWISFPPNSMFLTVSIRFSTLSFRKKLLKYFWLVKY